MLSPRMSDKYDILYDIYFRVIHLYLIHLFDFDMILIYFFRTINSENKVPYRILFNR